MLWWPSRDALVSMTGQRHQRISSCNVMCLEVCRSLGSREIKNVIQLMKVNSLTPGRCESNLQNVISDHILQIMFMGISYEISLKWMPQNTFDDKWTLIQVMALCRQSTSHYLIQCWPTSMPPYDTTKSLTQAQWWLYASVSWVIIGSINGLSPSWHLAFN